MKCQAFAMSEPDGKCPFDASYRTSLNEVVCEHHKVTQTALGRSVKKLRKRKKT